MCHLIAGPQWIVLEFDVVFTVATFDTFGGVCQPDFRLPAPLPAAAAAAVSDTLITNSELFGGGIISESDSSSSINISSDISSASYLLLLTVLGCGISGTATSKTNSHSVCCKPRTWHSLYLIKPEDKLSFWISFNWPIFPELLHVRTGPPKRTFGDCRSKVFLGWMLFLSTNQQCKSTEGVLKTNSVSEWVSEWVSRIQRPHQIIIGHFGDESFQSITCTGTDNLTRTTKLTVQTSYYVNQEQI